MQKTVYCCDICEQQINYPIADSQRDWSSVQTTSGNTLSICAACSRLIRKARDLGVVLPPPIGFTYVGGMSPARLVPGEAYTGGRNIAENSLPPTPYVDPD
jgi:hypothetical protein